MNYTCILTGVPLILTLIMHYSEKSYIFTSEDVNDIEYPGYLYLYMI